MSVLTSNNVIPKQPAEVLNVAMDFENWLLSTTTLSNPSVSTEKYGCPGTTDLVVTNIAVSGQKITMTISGGTDGNRYRVEVTTDTSTGETLEGDGILEVSDR